MGFVISESLARVARVSDSPDKHSLLSAFDLGPAWARGDVPEKKYDKHRGEDRPERKSGGRQPGGRDRAQGGARFGGGAGGSGRREGERGQRGGGRDDRRGGARGDRRDDRRGGGRDLPAPAPGVRVSIMPCKQAMHMLGKEIHHVARVYSLFDIAEILLGARERCSLKVVSDAKKPLMFRGKKDASLFLTRTEAAAHFWQSEMVSEIYETEEIETDPPKGNFQVVARCGFSGEWLGPPNFHSYQTNLRRLHREQFSNMEFDYYVSRVKTERGEEAVNEWMETMKKRSRWRIKGGGDEDWTFDRSELERGFSNELFERAFEETRDTELPGDVVPQNLSIGIFAAVRIAGGHARRHPAMLIPSACRFLEVEHLSVFKKKGKLFCGPSRPHPLPADLLLAERPTAIIQWIDANPDKKLVDLWKALLPEDSEEPPKEWLVDLFWLLTQGHVLLFADDLLVLPKRNQGAAAKKTAAAVPETGSKKKRRRKKRRRTFKARRHGPAKMIRGITRMSASQVRTLRGPARIWGRRLARRDRIESLLED